MDRRLAQDLDRWLTTPPDAPESETVTHNGESYFFDAHSEGDAQVTYMNDGGMPDYCHTVYYDFELSGAHDGPPIKVRMVGPKDEWDEDGWYPAWDKLLFSDDNSEVESAWILDFYTDALVEELRDIIRETWD